MNGNDSYFIQRTTGQWEEVDLFIWSNSQKVMDGNAPRYGENRFAIINGEITLSLNQITKLDLGIIARIAGVTIPTGSVQGGTVTVPSELLLVKNNRGFCFYDVRTGGKFKKVA